MDTPTTNKIMMIDSKMLTPLVRKALFRNDAEVIDWKKELLHGASFYATIYRFSGSARSRDEILPWSLILKTIHSPDGKDDPTSLNYWKREALAYQSGLLDNLPGGLSAPRCYKVIEQPGLEVWLWLEEIINETQPGWSLEQYGKMAHRLGQFNGAYFKERAMPTQPWLAKGWLREWTSGAIPVIPISASIRAHPLVARLLPNDIYQRMLQVWLEHEDWLGIIEHQPQTLSHLDAFRRNLFTRRHQGGEMQIFLIDWAFLGSAAPGEEIAPLVAASLNFLEIDADQNEALDKIVFEGYLEGLGETGWQGDPQMVRFTYAAASVLRYSIGVVGITSMIANENQHALLEQAFGHPLEELVDGWAKTTRFLYQLADEARGILRSIGNAA